MTLISFFFASFGLTSDLIFLGLLFEGIGDC
ncbi:uncharacterized protein METZ01_LOCUS438798 [marine metagenome]|uniref:Uncharacterized protein n=1 Tax=marine metagenome TaxID=408172 RepID=A0A382YRV5_9ZZZZ